MDVEMRHTVCRLIAGLVVADDDLAPEEDAFIDRLLARFGVPAGDRDTIFPIVDRTEAAVKIRELPAAVQEEALKLLLEAAVADGKVVDEERDYLRSVGEALGLGEAAVDKRLADALAARS